MLGLIKLKKYQMKNETKTKIRTGLVCLLLGACGLRVGDNILEQGAWERSRREVQMQIDSNSNRIITQEEWAPVYASLGVVPSGMMYGTDLSREQFESYIASRK